MVPVPTLVKPPVPDMMPLKVALVLLAPVDKVAEPNVTKLPATPFSEPMVSLKPLRSYVAPLATLTSVLSERASVIPACRLPALILVAPV